MPNPAKAHWNDYISPPMALMSHTVQSRPAPQPQVLQMTPTDPSSPPQEALISGVKVTPTPHGYLSPNQCVMTFLCHIHELDLSLKREKHAILFHRNHFRTDDLYHDAGGTKLFQACHGGTSQKSQGAHRAALRYLPKMSVIFCRMAFNLEGNLFACNRLCPDASLSNSNDRSQVISKLILSLKQR